MSELFEMCDNIPAGIAAQRRVNETPPAVSYITKATPTEVNAGLIKRRY